MRRDHAWPPEDQASLFDAAPVLRPAASGGTIQEAFEAFHAANPWVYDALCRLTRRGLAGGRRRLGIGMLFEVLRWNVLLATDDPASDFKLNNNYRSRYVRLMLTEHEEWSGVFELRELHTR